MQRFGGAIAGFALGGLLGGLLFGGMGGLGGGLGGGIGMFDILLIAGGIFLLVYFLRRRSQTQTQPAYAGTSAYGTAANTGAGGTAVLEMPAPSTEHGDLAEGIAHIRQMDPAFDTAGLAEWARSQFGNVQAAVAMRDIGMIRDRLAPEMYGVLLTQCEELKSAKRRSYVEKINLSRMEVTEAWQEKGQDFATVYLEGTMVDYTVDEATGAVVQGSKTEPARVDEFWTFTRPVGPNKWKLTAIQSA
jgi:predicted lipid-binding transport protein (Tim44 family)